MQLVWLEVRDLLSGRRSSNFSFSNLTSVQITDISPLQKSIKCQFQKPVLKDFNKKLTIYKPCAQEEILAQA